MANDDYLALVRESILDERFVSATLSGRQAGQALRWEKVRIRPVLVKDIRHLQFSYFDGQKDISKNYTGAELRQQLDRLLAEPFRNYNVLIQGERIQVNLSRKGRPVVSRHAANTPAEPSLAHNQRKKRVLSEGEPIPYLRLVGITDGEGRGKAGMQSKFKQINEFLRLLAETGRLESVGGDPVEVVDFGCGNAYLTFATYHYLTEVLGRRVRLVGVDLKDDLLAKHAAHARRLGWDGMEFVHAPIAEYRPAAPPDIVVALHACDTATDDAIAQGVRAGSAVIVCAPCCHHDLQVQLAASRPAPFGPLMSFGLLHERLGDVLTDGFRALLLRALGYHVDIVQFVSPEHTPKNLMIRAVKVARAGSPRQVREYLALKQFWGVEPYLHQLLRDEVDALIAAYERGAGEAPQPSAVEQNDAVIQPPRETPA